MAEQTLADQLLEAIQPLWGDEANAIRITWVLSGLGGDDPELLEWLAGEIETLIVLPYLLQADINLSLSDPYRTPEDMLDESPVSFYLQLDDDALVPLVGQHEGARQARNQWQRSKEPMVQLARRLQQLRRTIASTYDFDSGPPPENPINPPRKRPRRGGP
jgi:hypothetical protein